ASAHSSSGVVFMCLEITKVHQQTIPKVLRNMAIKALDDCSGSLLVGPYHLAPIFWVKLAGEERRVNEVTEHHRELASFGIWGATLHVGKCGLGALVVLGRRLGGHLAYPDQDSVVLVARQLLGLAQFDLA